MDANDNFLTYGKVKFYNEKRGFGFVIEEKTNKEYFFHIYGVIDKIVLQKDDCVFFELKEVKGKYRAVNVYKKK